MELLKIILLAIIQGVSEILPISSSGHLILFKTLLNINSSNLTFEILLHFGSLVAVIIYYFKDLKKILINSFKHIFSKNKSSSKDDFNLFIRLIISTFVTGVFGLLLSNLVDKKLSNLKFLPFFFLFTSLILYLSKFLKTYKSINRITILDSIIIGLFQLIGIIPGISRSGITIFGSQIRKIDHESSFKYAYLLFIPITLSSFILELIKLLKGNIHLDYPIIYYIIGIVVSFIVTYASMKLLSKIINKNKLYYFSFYLLLISILSLITYNYL